MTAKDERNEPKRKLFNKFESFEVNNIFMKQL